MRVSLSLHQCLDYFASLSLVIDWFLHSSPFYNEMSLHLNNILYALLVREDKIILLMERLAGCVYFSIRNTLFVLSIVFGTGIEEI